MQRMSSISSLPILVGPALQFLGLHLRSDRKLEGKPELVQRKEKENWQQDTLDKIWSFEKRN